MARPDPGRRLGRGAAYSRPPLSSLPAHVQAMLYQAGYDNWGKIVTATDEELLSLRLIQEDDVERIRFLLRGWQDNRRPGDG